MSPRYDTSLLFRCSLNTSQTNQLIHAMFRKLYPHSLDPQNQTKHPTMSTMTSLTLDQSPKPLTISMITNSFRSQTQIPCKILIHLSGKTKMYRRSLIASKSTRTLKNNSFNPTATIQDLNTLLLVNIISPTSLIAHPSNQLIKITTTLESSMLKVL